MPATPAHRTATSADAEALRDLERAASTAAFGSIFPPELYPYPDAAVLARWESTLEETAVTVLVTADEQGLTSLVAFDADRVRHLEVRPDCWRQGLARQAMRAAHLHSAPSRLWCLADNHGALAFYATLGWRPTGRSRDGEFPPHPTEIELAAFQD